ncbi:MAG: hypothetical protein K0U24_02510 [Gammaproteobacteria bacterium]|nr:hypothetical protein [Gammaproteobacteria bacterium]
MPHSKTHIKTRATRRKEDIEAEIEAIDSVLRRKIEVFREHSPEGATPDNDEYTSNDDPLTKIDICRKKIAFLNSRIQEHTPSRFTALWETFCNHFLKLFSMEELPETSARRNTITKINEGIKHTTALQAAQAIILVTKDRVEQAQQLEQTDSEVADIPNKIDALKAALQPLIKKTLYRELKTKATSAISTFGKFSKPDNKLFKISLTLTAQSLMHFLENPTEDNRQRFLKTEQQNHVDWQKAKNASVFMPLLVEANTVYDLEKALPEQQETPSESPKHT